MNPNYTKVSAIETSQWASGNRNATCHQSQGRVCMMAPLMHVHYSVFIKSSATTRSSGITPTLNTLQTNITFAHKPVKHTQVLALECAHADVASASGCSASTGDDKRRLSSRHAAPAKKNIRKKKPQDG